MMKSPYVKSMFALFAFLFLTSSYALDTPVLPTVTMEFHLLPNNREIYTNFSFSRIPLTATCTVTHAAQEGNDIFIEIIKKNGKINELPVATGDNIVVHVREKEVLKITAETGGQVALTNLGLNTVSATCSA